MGPTRTNALRDLPKTFLTQVTGWPWMRPLARSFALSIALVSVGVVFAGPSAAAPTLLPATMPTGLRGASAVWDPVAKVAYIFGGADDLHSATAAIQKFDPATGKVATVGQLPSPRLDAAAVWDGTTAYIVGGHDKSVAANLLDEVVAWTPGSAATVVAHTPSPVFGGVAGWTGSQVVYVGGQNSGAGNAMTTDILTWTPGKNKVKLDGSLPAGIQYTSGVWAGGDLYVFGGFDAKPGTGAANSAAIVKVTFGKSPVATTMKATIGDARGDHASVWDGTYAYVFGGYSNPDGKETVYDTVVRYDPATDSAVTLCTPLAARIAKESAVATGAGVAYLFGGNDAAGGFRRDIVRFDDLTRPGPVTGIVANPGSVTWTALPTEACGAVSYAVYAVAGAVSTVPTTVQSLACTTATTVCALAGLGCSATVVVVATVTAYGSSLVGPPSPPTSTSCSAPAPPVAPPPAGLPTPPAPILASPSFVTPVFSPSLLGGVIGSVTGHAALLDPGTTAAWAWDFGDGTAGSSVGQASHTYAVPGTYLVRAFTVTDGHLGVASAFVTIGSGR